MSSAIASKYGKGFAGFIRRKWDSNPDIVGSTVVAIFGLGIGVYTLDYYYRHNKDNRKYRQHYTVYRHDDPRVAQLRTD